MSGKKIRLEKDRNLKAQSRPNETCQERKIRLEKDRNLKAQSRANETCQERKIRLEKDRNLKAQSRANETPAERERRLEKMSNYFSQYREIRKENLKLHGECLGNAISKASPFVRNNDQSDIIKCGNTNFRVCKMPGKGNCLFNAISFILFGNVTGCDKIRNDAVQFVLENWDEFEGYLAGYLDDEVEGVVTPEKYREIMSKDGTYGGPVEIRAISNSYSIRIGVYFAANHDRAPEFVGSEACETVVNILFSGENDKGHYDALVAMGESVVGEQQHGKDMIVKENFESVVGCKLKNAGERKNKKKIELAGDISSGLYDKVEKFLMGDLNVECEFCGAVRFREQKGRSVNSCCHKGQVTVPPLTEYPVELEYLLTSECEDAKHFRENIRGYNASFAFATLGAHIEDLRGRGPALIKIQEQLYHHAE